MANDKISNMTAAVVGDLGATTSGFEVSADLGGTPDTLRLTLGTLADWLEASQLAALIVTNSVASATAIATPGADGLPRGGAEYDYNQHPRHPHRDGADFREWRSGNRWWWGGLQRREAEQRRHVWPCHAEHYRNNRRLGAVHSGRGLHRARTDWNGHVYDHERREHRQHPRRDGDDDRDGRPPPRHAAHDLCGGRWAVATGHGGHRLGLHGRDELLRRTQPPVQPNPDGTGLSGGLDRRHRQGDRHAHLV